MSHKRSTTHAKFVEQQARRFHPLESTIASFRIPKGLTAADKAKIIAAANDAVTKEWENIKSAYITQK